MNGAQHGRWWEREWAVALAIVAATVPLWFVRLPPLIDLLGHMGRYHVQLNLSTHPLLARSFDYHWMLIGNLGGDLLMEPLGRLFGVERGSIVLAGVILAVMISGIARLSRAVHGAIAPTAWAAFPFAMSYPWHYGLVNFWLGVGCALHAAAWFAHPGSEKPLSVRRAMPLLGVASLLLWVVHIYGWAVFAVIVWARRADFASLRRHVFSLWRLLPLGAPLPVMIALRYGQHGAAAETMGWSAFGYKVVALCWTLRDQIEWFDWTCLGVAAALIYAGFRSRAFARDAGLGRAALALLAALAIIPYQLFGSAYADARLWPVIFIVALIAVRPARPDGGLAKWLAFAAAATFAVRIAITAVGFQAYDRDFARHLAAFDLVPRGAKVAVFVGFPDEVSWRRPRMEHLDGIALVRRDVFTNTQWEVPGAQLLTPLALRGTRYNSDPSQYIMSKGDLRPGLAAKLADFPRERFDYVWVNGYRPSTLPHYAGLTPMFADDATILYRIDK